MSARNNLGRQFMDLYHGTDAESAKLIQLGGLHPAEGSPDVHTVAYDTKTAEEYAHDAADYRGADPAVVRMRVPADEWVEKYAGDVQDFGHSRAAGLRATIPPEYVKSVRHPRKRAGGYYAGLGEDDR